MNTGYSTVDEIGQLNIQGNVIPSIWFRNLTFSNGKPHFIAITILSEILYWYRPTVVRDEQSGVIIGANKKFRADKLQRNYQAFADQFGFTKRQVKDAMDYLEEHSLITREFREITTANGTKMNNVLFVEPVVENVKKITFEELDITLLRSDVPPPTLEGTTLLRSDVPPSYAGTEETPTLERRTNTIITTNTTTNNITDIITKESELEAELEGTTETEYQNAAMLIEQKYIQLRGNGLFASPKDIMAIQEVVAVGIPVKDVLKYLEESFKRYEPKYPGDKINGFAYCKTYILHQHYLSEQRKNAHTQTKGGQVRDKHSGSTKTNCRRPSGPSEETRRLEELARKKGLIQPGTVRDIDVDF